MKINVCEQQKIKHYNALKLYSNYIFILILCKFSVGFYPAGRLATDSEGLMLLTNEGRLQQRITEPKFKLSKTYWVQVEGNITAEAREALQLGVVLREFTTAPSQAVSIEPPDKLWPRMPPYEIVNTFRCLGLPLSCVKEKNRQVWRVRLFELALSLGTWRFMPAEALR